jgi:hypothetical protein
VRSTVLLVALALGACSHSVRPVVYTDNPQFVTKEDTNYPVHQKRPPSSLEEKCNIAFRLERNERNPATRHNMLCSMQAHGCPVKVRDCH